MIEGMQVVWSERVAIMEATQDELESAVREHSRTVYKVAFAALRNHHDAEDAAQETYLRFWRHRKHWAQSAIAAPGWLGQPGAWLWTG